MTRYPSVLAVCVAATLAAACGFQHSSSVTAPTQSAANAASAAAAQTSASGSTAPSLVGVWTSSVTPTLPSASSCGNFQYQIASQTATTIAGTFTASCGNGLTISASANGRLDGTNVTLTVDGSGSMPGLPNCNFNVTSNGAIQDNGNTLYLPYSGTTCLGPVHGTETLHKPQPQQAAPAPAPAPPPPPPPAPSGPSDGLDLHSAVITGGSPQDVANWPITTQITGLDFGGNGLRIDFSKKDGPDRWPDVVPPGWDGPIQYTVWMVVNVGGRWYTSGGVEYWYGLDRSGGPPASYAYNWYYNPQVWGPLANQQPGNGQQTGFFVTAGDQRVKDAHIVAERSNVVVLPFPSGGGYFTFAAGRTR